MADDRFLGKIEKSKKSMVRSIGMKFGNLMQFEPFYPSVKFF